MDQADSTARLQSPYRMDIATIIMRHVELQAQSKSLRVQATRRISSHA